MKVHHIGYLVKNIDKSVKEFKKIGFQTVSDITLDTARNINICFMVNGTYMIELIAPVDKSGPVGTLLKKMGGSNTPYHLCYETDQINNTITALQSQGYILIEETTPAIAINNNNVAFLYHKDIGIIELLEIKNG